MSQWCVLGRHGLLGGALAKRLGHVTSYPTEETKVVFHFGSYTHLQFEENPEYHMAETLASFVNLLPYCRARGIQFVYPSSALVYEKDTPFSRFKTVTEVLAACYGAVSLGLRIFPVYGPRETRTVISQWCRKMSRGERPTIYGDGTQARDFIYVDDAVAQILEATDKYKWVSKIVDIGSGNLTKFNDIVAIINETLATKIEPQYVSRPTNYSEGIVSREAMTTKVSIKDGIRKVLLEQ